MRRLALAISLIATLSYSTVISITQAQTSQAGIRAYREANETKIINEFVELLSIPNVASDQPNIRRNAEKLIEMMRERGIETRLLEGKGSPAVYGEIKTPGATRTIGFYAHYDGQPADPKTWASDPFKPVLRDKPVEAGGKEVPFPKAGERFDPESRLFARSASDDKGPIQALMTALDAIKATNKRLTSNIKFLFEGEEEDGSPYLDDIIARNTALLKADAWICADGPVHQTRRQLIYFGVRGIVQAHVTVYGPIRGLHSGHYGNWVPNPAMRLAKLLASMKDDSGRVLIKGFYDDVVPLGEEEKKALSEVPALESELMKEFLIASVDGAGRSLMEMINQPSLNVDGIRSEYVGREARTIIPTEATATIDLRLVKGNDPRRQVERVIEHIRSQGYHVTQEEPDRETRLKYPMIARVTSDRGYKAVRTSMSLPVSKQIIRAVEQAAGERPVIAPTLGGSVPLYIIEVGTGSPQIGVPIVNHDNNQHSINENIRIKNLWDGIEVYASIMTMN